jgi:hypothetical protein
VSRQHLHSHSDEHVERLVSFAPQTAKQASRGVSNLPPQWQAPLAAVLQSPAHCVEPVPFATQSSKQPTLAHGERVPQMDAHVDVDVPFAAQSA